MGTEPLTHRVGISFLSAPLAFSEKSSILGQSVSCRAAFIELSIGVIRSGLRQVGALGKTVMGQLIKPKYVF